MRILVTLLAVTLGVALVCAGPIIAAEEAEMSNSQGQLDTGVMGGVPVPSKEELAAMQKGQYILRARGGKLTRVPVEKNLLPHDPQGHVQILSTAVAPDGTVYVNQNTMVCKSTDGGRTWTSYSRQGAGLNADSMTGSFQVLSDGAFLAVRCASGGGGTDPAAVWSSHDEGRTWERTTAQLKVPEEYHTVGVYGLFQFEDRTLLCGLGCSNTKQEGNKWLSGAHSLLAYRSTDEGRTWEGPSKICDWGAEGGIARTASGRLLAVVRYQRPLLPTDPPDLLEQTGGSEFPYKHVFLVDSEDGGRTWKNFRQLATVFGQCYGFPATLSDGTAVVVHDTRYGPGEPCGRAMISRDEGRTWQDEVYYTHYGSAVSGYSQSVVLGDDLILTVAGTCDNEPARSEWHEALGKSDLTAIRWKPVID